MKKTISLLSMIALLICGFDNTVKAYPLGDEKKVMEQVVKASEGYEVVDTIIARHNDNGNENIKQAGGIKHAESILIDKETMKLSVVDYMGKTVSEYPIACGKNYGNKQKPGDMRTPEGVFHISEVIDASSWTHDFKDGKGEIDGAYGPYFIRLDTPGHKGIGIHGTHLPESIGTRATEGCIRLKNEDLIRLKDYVYPGMVVIITPSSQDALINAKDKEPKYQTSNQKHIN